MIRLVSVEAHMVGSGFNCSELIVHICSRTVEDVLIAWVKSQTNTLISQLTSADLVLPSIAIRPSKDFGAFNTLRYLLRKKSSEHHEVMNLLLGEGSWFTLMLMMSD